MKEEGVLYYLTNLSHFGNAIFLIKKVIELESPYKDLWCGDEDIFDQLCIYT